MNLIFSIDPGPQLSAFVLFCLTSLKIFESGKCRNSDIRRMISTCGADAVVIEQIKSYGNVMGDSVLSTCVEIGRMIEAAERAGVAVSLIPRKTVAQCLCANSRVGDKQIRQAVIDIYPATGAGRVPQIGTKASPGPLYGVAGDVWSALAVALAFKAQAAYLA